MNKLVCLIKLIVYLQYIKQLKTIIMTKTLNIAQLENKISNMKKDGKYTTNFLVVFGSMKNLELKSEDILIRMNKFLTKKGF